MLKFNVIYLVNPPFISTFLFLYSLTILRISYPKMVSRGILLNSCIKIMISSSPSPLNSIKLNTALFLRSLISSIKSIIASANCKKLILEHLFLLAILIYIILARISHGYPKSIEKFSLILFSVMKKNANLLLVDDLLTAKILNAEVNLFH